MALIIRFEAECDCGGTYRTSTLDLSQDPGEDVVVHVDLIGDMSMRCEQCGSEIWVPSVSDFIEEVEND